MGISLGATMITLRERIKAALHLDAYRNDVLKWLADQRADALAKDARELLPLVLAEMDALPVAGGMIAQLRADLARVTADLNDQRDEHIKAEALRAELAAMTAERDKLDRDNDLIRDECKRVMAERDAVRAERDAFWAVAAATIRPASGGK